MAHLTLMVGLPASGKTTRAKLLAEQTGALRLTPDEWQTRLFDDDMHHPDHDRRHATIEAIMWEIAAHVLTTGGDVILDFGFWTRAERLDFAARAAALGASCSVQYEHVDIDHLLQRLEARNREPGRSFVIPAEAFRHWATLFEVPKADEIEGRFGLEPSPPTPGT